ncbi:MAG: hypothetical protein AB1454_06825 [Candidatus Auribacterota bacterium]
MKPLNEFWTIVLVGKWNTNIFTTEWVIKNLDFNEESTKMEINLADFSHRLYDDELILIPKQDRLIIGLKNITDDLLKKLGKTAKKIVETLPHTPINSYGINFGFSEENSSHELSKLFTHSDLGDISSAGGTILDILIKKTIQFTEYELRQNITFYYEKPSYVIHLNFHHLFDFETMKRIFETKILEYKEKAVDFLKTVYCLEQKGETDE